MGEQVDPLDKDFQIRSLKGDELLVCRQCGTTYEIGYADAIRNEDVGMPYDACCRKMMETFLRQLWDMEADSLIVSDIPGFRRAAVEIRNRLRAE